MSSKDIAQSWKDQSREDIVTAQALLKSKRYAPCLFFLHLAIEKQLKAKVVLRTKKPAPYTHDLLTLARIAECALSPEQEDYLREVNTFNIRARYDDYKYAFYKRATPVFSKNQLKHAQTFLVWLQHRS